MPLLALLLAVGLPTLAFTIICAVAGVKFTGAVVFGLVMAVFVTAWLFEVRRLVEEP
jgi:hypothetical protein